MDLENLFKSVVSIATPLLALVSLGARRRHLRSEVRDNLALIEEIKKDQAISQHSPAVGLLSGKIVLDIAKLAGQPIGARKKPIPWGSVIFASLLALVLGFWTYLIDRDGFVWYSVFPGTLAFLLAVSVLGMTTNRQIPEDPDLPEGAVPIRTESAAERVAGAVQLAASGADTGMFADQGQVGAALKFIGLMGNGDYEEGLAFADRNWELCRIQARLWNMHIEGTLTAEELPALAKSLHERHEPKDFWAGYVAAEAEQFKEAWGNLDPGSVGAASNRRRMARDYDLVLLVPLNANEGYFVTSATAVPGALPFLMHRVENRWVVSNHLGSAPPTPGFPPSWWFISDPVVAQLPEK